MRGYGKHQHAMRRATKNIILNTLIRSEIGMTFTVLKRATKISSRTLTKVLRELQNEGIVERCKTSEMENLDNPKVMKEILDDLWKIQQRLTLDDFLTKRVKMRRKISMETTKQRATSARAEWRRIWEIYFKSPDDITKKPEHIRSFLKWLKGFSKHTKTPREIRQFIKSLSKPIVVYRIKKPKPICKGERK